MFDKSFSTVLNWLKDGAAVHRAGWNGKGMYIVMVKGPDWDIEAEIANRHKLNLLAKLPWIGMKTADGSFVPWLASQSDILSNDWEIYVE